MIFRKKIIPKYGNDRYESDFATALLQAHSKIVPFKIY